MNQFRLAAALVGTCGLLAGCGRTEPYQTARWNGLPDTSADLPRTIVDSSGGYYNADLGTVLDGTQPQFPLADLAGGDPRLFPAGQPDLSAASESLGAWLGKEAPSSNGHWRLVPVIPASWALNTETAIVYPIFADAPSRLQGSFGVDNGLFVWVNGTFRFGAVEPGGSNPNEYPDIDLGAVAAGVNFVQVLREDHGTGTDFHVNIRFAQK